MRYLITLLLLCYGTVLFADDRYGVFEITLMTGNDDLRENSRAELVVRLNNGRELRQLMHNPGERLADRTQKNTSLNFAPAIVLSEIEQVSLAWTRDGGDMVKRPDEWEMAELRLGVRNSRNELHTFFVSPRRKFVESGVFPLDSTVVTATPAQCTSDIQCDDGRFCTGVERCAPGTIGSDARGCIAATNPVCSSGMRCDETRDRCLSSVSCPDNDGDGVTAAHCGGSDCDDNDPRRYPGNVEIWDSEGRDEDCDASTSGVERTSLFEQSPQVCSGRRVLVLSSPHRLVSCSGTMVCIPQPNGSGVCGVEPPGYQTPAEITLPETTQPRPRPVLPVKKLPGEQKKKN